MKHEPVILIADSKEIFDEMEPVISKKLGTTQIIHADNSASASSLILDSQIHFDLIFVDWQMVGAKFVDAVRNDEKNGCTPLIVMSELDTNDVIATATRHGASGFLAKPFLVKGLLNKIKHVMNNQERRRRTRLRPEHPVSITADTERAGAIEGRLIDFSLDFAHICFDKLRKEELIIGDSALVKLEIDNHRVDLPSEIVRVEKGKNHPDQSILILYKFAEPHEVRAEKMEELLDENRAYQ